MLGIITWQFYISSHLTHVLGATQLAGDKFSTELPICKPWVQGGKRPASTRRDEYIPQDNPNLLPVQGLVGCSPEPCPIVICTLPNSLTARIDPSLLMNFWKPKDWRGNCWQSAGVKAMQGQWGCNGHSNPKWRSLRNLQRQPMKERYLPLSSIWSCPKTSAKRTTRVRKEIDWTIYSSTSISFEPVAGLSWMKGEALIGSEWGFWYYMGMGICD